jgi:hypothetical protein
LKDARTRRSASSAVQFSDDPGADPILVVEPA